MGKKITKKFKCVVDDQFDFGNINLSECFDVKIIDSERKDVLPAAISKERINEIYKFTKSSVDTYLSSNEKIRPPSLSELERKKSLGVSRPIFTSHIKDYLFNRFGEVRGIELFNKMWSRSRTPTLPKQKIESIYRMIQSLTDSYIESGKLVKPPSLRVLSERRDININQETLAKYVLEYLTDRFGETVGKEIYNEMWASKTISQGLIDKIYDSSKKALDIFQKTKKKIKPRTLETLSKSLGISNLTFTKYAKEFLIRELGTEEGERLYNEMWLPILNDEQIQEIFNFAEDMLTNFLRSNGIELPPTLSKLEKDFNVSRATLTRYILVFFSQKLGAVRAEEVYNSMWSHGGLSFQDVYIPPSVEIEKDITIEERFSIFKKTYLDTIDSVVQSDLLFKRTRLARETLIKIHEITRLTVWEFIESDGKKKPINIKDLLKAYNLNISYLSFARHSKRFLGLVFGSPEGYILYDEMWVPTEIPQYKKDVIHRVTQSNLDKFLDSGKLIFPPPLHLIIEEASLNISPTTFSRYAQLYLKDKFGKDKGIKLYSELWSPERSARMGQISHILINDLLTHFFKSLGIFYFSEPRVYPDVIPDGLLLITEELFNLLLSNKHIINSLKIEPSDLASVKSLVVDFTSDTTENNILNKVRKYQKSDVMLFIVGTFWYSDDPIMRLPQDDLVFHPENIKIFSYKILLELFNLDKKFRQLFENITSSIANNNLEKLEDLRNDRDIFRYGSEDLKKLLIKDGLIQEKISEYLNFGRRDYPIKNTWTEREDNDIKECSNMENKVAIIDIETTTFIKDKALIVEIGIIELDTDSKKMKILFNSPIYEEGIMGLQDASVFKISDIEYDIIKDARPLEEYRVILQSIFNCYKITSYNIHFDFGILELRGFKFPKRLPDIMKYAKDILPKGGKYNFEYCYNYLQKIKSNSIDPRSGNKYLENEDYIEQHRALDDAFHEAELLYFLIHNFNYPIKSQRKLFFMEDNDFI